MLKALCISDRSSQLFIPILTLLILTSGVIAGARAAGGSQSVKFPRKVQAAFDKRESQIDVELERYPVHEWAGIYHLGSSGIGTHGTIKLSPIAGFIGRWSGCTGVFSINYGSVRWDGSTIRLLTERPSDRRESFKPVIEMIPVRWGVRRYLIAANEMVDFCNAVNSGWEPDRMFFGSHFLLRRGDEKRKVSGEPEVPQQYRDYILSSPIEAEIIGLISSRIEIDDDAKWKRLIARITLSAGYAEGMRVGMKFYPFEPKLYQSARIVRVSKHTAEAEMTDYDMDVVIPEVGWKLSTRNH